MIGETISHYKILEKLGEGGMGVVYKAEDIKLKRTVALKFLPPELTRDPEAKKRFIHEAQAASALDHSNICTIHEIDETKDGQTFIAMSFIEGQNLINMIEKGPLKMEEAIDIAIHVAEGLYEAHQKGIIHRDIKPGNIMITTKGQAIIMDFGIAKSADQTVMTKSGTIMGTTNYMSPEQACGKKIDNRSDIWSLGVLMYEMITGQLPFKGEYTEAIIFSIQNEEPEPPTALRTGVPKELERIVLKALVKAPDQRYQHVDEIIVDLKNLIKDLDHTLSKEMPTEKRRLFLPSQSTLALKTKTLGLANILFVINCILLAVLFNIPFVQGLFEIIESFIYYQIFTSTANPHENLLILDEEDKIYDRATYAKLIAGLDELGARVITMDVLFQGTKDATGDSLLVAATHSASDKIIHTLEFLGYDKHDVIPERFHFRAEDNISPENYIDGILGVMLPFDGLLRVTKYLGHITTSSDIARRGAQYYPLIILYNDRLYPSMPLLAVMKYIGCSIDTLPKIEEDVIKLEANTTVLEIPISNKSQILVNFIPPSKFAGKHFSIEKALNYIDEESSVFFNKIVLIGNSLESRGYTHGPHFKSYPNLYIYAILISQMLNGENIQEGILESFAVSLLLLLLGIVLLFLFFHRMKGHWTWSFYAVALFIFLLIVAFTLTTGMRLYVLIPYFVFCFSFALTKRYYIHKLKSG